MMSSIVISQLMIKLNEFKKDIEALPPPLRAMLEAELTSGNEIVEVGHSFPAPPVGAYFKLANLVTTFPHRSTADIHFYDRNTPQYSGEFSDAKRFFFILEPPHPPPPEPDMDKIRSSLITQVILEHEPYRSEERESPLYRFKRSMPIDYEKWHDGIGYDLQALQEANADEREIIERILIDRNSYNWRDIEALAMLDTSKAREALRSAMSDKEPEVRMSVLRYAPDLISDADRSDSIVESLRTGKFFRGLTITLDLVEEFHPPEVMRELLRGVLEREGEVAVHFAAMLLFINGKTNEPFDMALRPFFLRFNTEVTAERRRAFRELCQMIGVNAKDHLPTNTEKPSSRRH